MVRKRQSVRFRHGARGSSGTHAERHPQARHTVSSVVECAHPRGGVVASPILVRCSMAGQTASTRRAETRPWEQAEPRALRPTRLHHLTSASIAKRPTRRPCKSVYRRFESDSRLGERKGCGIEMAGLDLLDGETVVRLLGTMTSREVAAVLGTTQNKVMRTLRKVGFASVYDVPGRSAPVKPRGKRRRNGRTGACARPSCAKPVGRQARFCSTQMCERVSGRELHSALASRRRDRYPSVGGRLRCRPEMDLGSARRSVLEVRVGHPSPRVRTAAARSTTLTEMHQTRQSPTWN